ncbi:MAG: hypothetical protein RLZZ126_1911 [Pseudomonadota bacterium]|jgi:enoyl-CoA hydratase/carnithine racemase
MSYQHLLLSEDRGITTITLNVPEKRNALALPVIAELHRAFLAVGQSDAMGVILAANGPVFCSGHNFADMVHVDLEQARHVFDTCRAMMDAMQQMPQPVLARVHALATAGGCQLVATCDLAVASDQAAFALPGGKGAHYCHTPLVAVARNLGRKRALELSMTGDPISAQTAAEWGLVNYCVPHAELHARADDLIRRASRGTQASKGLGKRTYYAQIGMPQDDAYDFASAVMADATVTPEAQAHFAAFFARRKTQPV